MARETLTNASAADARARMLSHIERLAAVEHVALDEAFGRTLASDILAQRDQPPFAASAMDGYALRAADTPGALKVIGESSAGAGLAGRIGAGEAARIFTGAPLPDGADSVAIQEDVTRDGDAIQAPQTPLAQHVRPRALDFKAGDRLLPAGTLLDGVALSLAAAGGRAAIPLVARPRVALLATGDEIVEPGGAPGPHQIFESVSFGLAGLVRHWGGAPSRLAARGDDLDILADAMADALARHDLLITIGGASVGDRDLVKPALAKVDMSLEVERANIRPGKPVWFATTKHAPVLGLPGNPASALACAYLFLRPILAAMQGRAYDDGAVKAALTSALPANGPREHYVRARLSMDGEGRARVSPFEQQDSSLLSIFRDADALIRLAARAPALDAGALVDVLPLGRFGG